MLTHTAVALLIGSLAATGVLDQMESTHAEPSAVRAVAPQDSAQDESRSAPPRRGVRAMPDWAEESWWLRRRVGRPIALVGANVVNVRDGSMRENVTIVIRGDRIESISDEPPGQMSRRLTAAASSSSPVCSTCTPT